MINLFKKVEQCSHLIPLCLFNLVLLQLWRYCEGVRFRPGSVECVSLGVTCFRYMWAEKYNPGSNRSTSWRVGGIHSYKDCKTLEIYQGGEVHSIKTSSDTCNRSFVLPRSRKIWTLCTCFARNQRKNVANSRKICRPIFLIKPLSLSTPKIFFA